MALPADGAAPNLPTDTDGDGEPDYVLCGDFDGDGHTRPADVQACNDALSDPGPRHVELIAASFDIPDAGLVAPAPGLIRPSAGTRISCLPGARIIGVDERYPSGLNVAVIYVDQPDVTIGPGCEIDGGFAEGAPCSGPCPIGEHRMGVLGATGSSNLTIEDNTIHHTAHACVYVRNAAHRTIRRNTLWRCGGAWAKDREAGFLPAIYTYNDDPDAPTLHTKILDNVIAGAWGLSLRARGDEANQLDQDLLVEGNTIIDTRVVGGTYAPCMFVGSVRDLFIGENLCLDSGPVSFGNRAPDFYDSAACNQPVPAPGCFDAKSGVTIDGLEMERIHVEGRGGAIATGTHDDRIRLHDIEIRGVVDGGCYYVAGRLRDFQASQLGCEDAEFAFRVPSGDWWPGRFGDEDALHVDGFDFREIWGSAVLKFTSGLENSSFRNGTVAGYRRYGLKVSPASTLRGNTFANVRFDQLGAEPMGNAFLADLGTPPWLCDATLEGASIAVLDSDGGCETPGNAVALCTCDAGAWRSMEGEVFDGGGSSFEITGAISAANVLRDVEIRTVLGNHGVRLGAGASHHRIDRLHFEDTAIAVSGQSATSDLPTSPARGACYEVVDAANGGDCTSGGGSTRNLCCWDGSGWRGDLGASGPALAGIGVVHGGSTTNRFSGVECERTSVSSSPCAQPALPASAVPVPGLGPRPAALLALLLGAVGITALALRRLPPANR